MSKCLSHLHRIPSRTLTAPRLRSPPQSRRLSTATSTTLDVRPIAGSLGAEIHGLDLASISPATAQAIRQAWLEHKVVFFRDQDHLSPQQFLDFSARLGKPVEYPFVKGIEGYPEIIEVLKREHETVNFGGVWHADTTYLKEPPMATLLLAREVPPYGGDTLFANQVAAHAALSPGLQTTLATLTGISTSAKADASKTREDRIKDSSPASPQQEALTAHHPAVRTHPETGLRSLYVNVAHTERFADWTAEESGPLLRFLHEWQVRPEFTCRFRWERGSVALWDNRAVLHNPVNDYQGWRRRMLRITLAGDVPR